LEIAVESHALAGARHIYAVKLGFVEGIG